MGKYRKIPQIVEANQWNGKSITPKVLGVCYCVPAGDYPAHVHTIHDNQIVYLQPGDWILPEPDGEHYYPIKPHIFAAIYEPVEEPGK